MKYVISTILLIVMLFGTFISYSSGRTFVFAGGSAGSVMDFAVINRGLPIFLLLLFGILLFVYFKQRKMIVIVFLGIVMFFWLLSGRMIGIIVDPNGKIVTGWFYIPTETFFVCDGKTDCQRVLYYETKIIKLPFWRIKLKNVNVDKTLFIGPLIWQKTFKILSVDSSRQIIN